MSLSATSIQWVTAGGHPLPLTETGTATHQQEANRRRLRDADRYERHLRAILRQPCRCVRRTCWRCLSSLLRSACQDHVDTCDPCIAEHALYLAGDHEAVHTRGRINLERMLEDVLPERMAKP